jgi:hypothetical protein
LLLVYVVPADIASSPASGLDTFVLAPNLVHQTIQVSMGCFLASHYAPREGSQKLVSGTSWNAELSVFGPGLATNLVKHARAGYAVISPFPVKRKPTRVFFLGTMGLLSTLPITHECDKEVGWDFQPRLLTCQSLTVAPQASWATFPRFFRHAFNADFVAPRQSQPPRPRAAAPHPHRRLQAAATSVAVGQLSY